MQSTMQLGMVGLGRMGANMTKRLVGGGHRVPVEPAVCAVLGAVAVKKAERLLAALLHPRPVGAQAPAPPTVAVATDSPAAATCSVRTTSAIGERQMLPRHTSATA